jgi:agmatinase
MRFFTDAFTEERANVIAFGVPLGEYGKKSLESLRKASRFVESFDVDSKRNLLENVRIFDAGDVQFLEVTEKVKEIRNSKKIPLMLSNGHLPTLHSLRGFDHVKLIVFDAHTDLYDKYTDEKMQVTSGNSDEVFSEATWLRRFCEENKKSNVMLIGIRSANEDQLSYLSDFKYFTSNFVKGNMETVRKEIEKFTKDSGVYISVDIDAFDPSIAPAVEHPEPDGIYFNHFRELINSVKGKIIGLDVCCLKPIENNEVTEFLAVKVIFEILGLIK